MKKIYLGVNIDHVATVRNARGTKYPDPIHAAEIAERAGADGITIHLREDRRHITDRDVYLLKDTIQTRMNLEMAVTEEMINIALMVKPTYVCFVPEKRAELTTEGGLDVSSQVVRISLAVQKLMQAGIEVSLFIDADKKQIDAAQACGAPFIELHTGSYAEATTEHDRYIELEKIREGAEYADSLGIKVNAGHGLTYHNVGAIAAIPQIYELNIGHSIIGRAVFDGLAKAVTDMKIEMEKARG